MSLLMEIISANARAILENQITRTSSIIDFGKMVALTNEFIQKDLLNSVGIKAYDPKNDPDCPTIDVKNNSPGFDILAINPDTGKSVRIQTKLRQVKGNTDFSTQTHFETTRRHSKKNEGAASDSGHVAYSHDEFDFVLVSLINVKNDMSKRCNVDKWSFSLIPVNALIDKNKGCCYTHIPARVLAKYEYKFDPLNPPNLNIIPIENEIKLEACVLGK